MTTTFEVVAEPSRRRILDLLLDGPLPVGKLVRRTGMSQPNTFRHLRILRETGIESRPDPTGSVACLRLHPQGLAELMRWLAPYTPLREGSLDALERHLDEKE